MTRFMLAFLQDGAVDGVSILKPETVRQMEARQFEFHPMLPGLGITFMEYLIDPVRIIAHGGDTVYFHSDMILVPDAHLGYFLSYNSLGKDVGGGRGEVWRTFVNRYFGVQANPRPRLIQTRQNRTGVQSAAVMMERAAERQRC
jgi:CubicO group peptidase (beta-lactamase class C family)